MPKEARVAGLKHTMAAIPGGSTRRTYGVAHHAGGLWYAKIGDSLLTARWNAEVRPQQGLPIVVDITNDGQGQSTALVVCAYVDQPKPGTGTASEVIPGGPATEIVFVGEDGITYRTDQFIGEYNPGDPVYLAWDADKPTILGRIGAIAPPPPPVSAPPPPPTAGNGSTVLTATASDTFGVGGWGRWAGSTNGGEDVYTGSWGGYTLTGSWFYGAARPELAGKTATRIQFKVPARLAVGSNNAAATIHFYAHTSGSRPAGDVARVTGPHDISIPAGWQGGYVDLPTSFFPALAGGGGISIAGDPYAGFISRLDDPEAGKLILDWTV